MDERSNEVYLLNKGLYLLTKMVGLSLTPAESKDKHTKIFQ